LSTGSLFLGPAWDVAALVGAGELHFVYLDPPYGVGTAMTARTAKGERRGRLQRQSGPVAYEDTQPVLELVAMLVKAAEAIRPRLARAATFAVHLDHRAVHEAKVALDDVFGRGAFLGEIIWVPGNGARGAGLSMTHQTILLFCRAPAERRDATWNAEDPRLREPYSSTSLAMHFTNVDEAGRRFRERTIGAKTYRYYADAGRKLGTVWTDLPAMKANTPLHREGTGYPTQKPIALLERLVVATTREGQVVADLMCGSGTTLVAAAKLGRRFVGGDSSELAIDVTEARLSAMGVEFTTARR
jgi:site-specific DNA-methyltransferase (adenine-specific)